MIRKSVSYIIIFSFLLTASGCFTTQHYSDPPEVLIAKEKGKTDIVYDNIDSLTLINKKSVSLSDYTSRFIKSYSDSSYKFIYYFKSSVLDTIDIKNITSVHYSITKADNKKVLPYTIALMILPFVIWGLIHFMMPHGIAG
jgi:hypothetical protein